eukprot:1348200-Pyramimonas_sp.AAC.1
MNNPPDNEPITCIRHEIRETAIRQEKKQTSTHPGGATHVPHALLVAVPCVRRCPRLQQRRHHCRAIPPRPPRAPPRG